MTTPSPQDKLREDALTALRSNLRLVWRGHNDAQIDGTEEAVAAILALLPIDRLSVPSGEVETDERGEAMVCTGCGTTRTVAAIRASSATAFTCCPERKMIPVRDALALATPTPAPSPDMEVRALREAIQLIDEINERKSSRDFHGINQPLHNKIATIRATLARALSSQSSLAAPVDKQ